MADNHSADRRPGAGETRQAQAGETDTTRFGMEHSEAEEPTSTGGGSDESQATGDTADNNIQEEVK